MAGQLPSSKPPVIQLTTNTRIREGERLPVSYYHPIIVDEDRLTSCITEPKVFADWREEVKRANDLIHPAAFFMSHDEMRVKNQCAFCQSRHLTPGQRRGAKGVTGCPANMSPDADTT